MEYEELANAIVIKAVDDYKKALKTLKNNPESSGALHTKKEIEQFFNSEWFSTLTAVNPLSLIEQAKKNDGASFKRKPGKTRKKKKIQKEKICYKKCKTCDYFYIADKVCQYMLFTGMMRNSEPENCDKWEKRKKTKKKSLAEW